MKQDRGVVVGLDRHGIRVRGIGFLESFDAAAWSLADWNHRYQIGAQLDHLAAGDPCNHVQPVRADVGNGAELAAEFRIEPPVPVSRVKQPILQKAAMNEFGLADGAFHNESASFLAKRVVTQVVSNAADFPCFAGESDEQFRLGRIHCQRLLAEDVFSRAHQAAGLVEGEIVGGAEVNYINGRIRGEFVERGIGAFQAEGFAGRGRSLAGTSERATNGDSQTAQRFDVGPADKSQANHSGGQIHTVRSQVPVRSQPERQRRLSGLYGTYPEGVDCVSYVGGACRVDSAARCRYRKLPRCTPHPKFTGCSRNAFSAVYSITIPPTRSRGSPRKRLNSPVPGCPWVARLPFSPAVEERPR